MSACGSAWMSPGVQILVSLDKEFGPSCRRCQAGTQGGGWMRHGVWRAPGVVGCPGRGDFGGRGFLDSGLRRNDERVGLAGTVVVGGGRAGSRALQRPGAPARRTGAGRYPVRRADGHERLSPSYRRRPVPSAACGWARGVWRAPGVVGCPGRGGCGGRGFLDSGLRRNDERVGVLRMRFRWCSPSRSLQALSAAMLERRMISISSVISSWRARLLRRARSSSCSSMRWRACSMCSRRSWFSCSSAS